VHFITGLTKVTDSDTTLQSPTSNVSVNSTAAPINTHTASFALLWLFVVLIVAAISFGAYFVSKQSANQQQIISNLRTQVEQQAKAMETRQQLLEDNLDKASGDPN
jgi:uroporphyrin-3 C-methyltransferase